MGQSNAADSEGIPLNPSKFPAHEIEAGKLIPHKLFLRDADGKTEISKDGGSVNPWLDPYEFFLEAGLINSDHYVSSRSGKAIYGGKSILRVNEKGKDVSLSSKPALSQSIALR